MTVNKIRTIFIFILIMVLFSMCVNNADNDVAYKKNKIESYLQKGDNLYKSKSGPEVFLKSMELYDSAWNLSIQIKDSSLIAESIYAKGRAFDALNNNPQKSIDYYLQAANLFEKITSDKIKFLYITHLVAHAYEKADDSLYTMKYLKKIESEFQKLDSQTFEKINFVPQMALIASIIKNYDYSHELLNKYTKRSKIINDSLTYNYLYSYYLAKANIEVYHLNNFETKYIDSVRYALRMCNNASDSLYYSNELHLLNAHIGNKETANYYLQLNSGLFNKLVTNSKKRMVDIKISQMEQTIARLEKQNIETKANLRLRYISILIILIIVISALSIYLFQKNQMIKHKQLEIKNKNAELEKSVTHNKILNTELQHRVKNNLQVISSLIQMKERGANVETIKNLKEIRIRIENIGILHTKLRIDNQIQNFSEYINSIVENIILILSSNKKVNTNLKITQDKVPYAISFPVGLILNEWITNSIKHANPSSNQLDIDIEIFKENDALVVIYKDNGEIHQASKIVKSIGTEIVEILSLQLNAKLLLDENHKFKYRLIIPDSQIK